MRDRRAPVASADVGYEQIKIPESLDWMVWRIVTSERFSSQPDEVRSWYWEDVFSAHMVLDMYETAEIRALKRSRANSR